MEFITIDLEKLRVSLKENKYYKQPQTREEYLGEVKTIRKKSNTNYCLGCDYYGGLFDMHNFGVDEIRADCRLFGCLLDNSTNTCVNYK